MTDIAVAALKPSSVAMPMAAKKTVRKPKTHTEFAHDMEPEAACLMLQASATGNVLFIRRGDKGDHPGEWALPGGHIEKGEPPMIASLREMREETGFINETGKDPSPLSSLHTGDVQLAIYKLNIPNEFIPTLNDESKGWAWAPLDNPPQPFHTGLKGKEDKLHGLDKAANEATHSELTHTIRFPPPEGPGGERAINVEFRNGSVGKESLKESKKAWKLNTTTHDEKSSKAEACYTDGPVDKEPCKTCSMFQTPDGCIAVEGDIEPNGHCDFYEADAGALKKDEDEIDSEIEQAEIHGLDTDFKENEHPRDDDGKFTSGGGTGGGSFQEGTQHFSAESDLPEGLNGIKFNKFSPPEDWNAVEGINKELKEAPLKGKPPYDYLNHKDEIVSVAGKKPASGVFITEPDGRVWIIKPKNRFGGYKQTFPKGKVDEGLSPQANAIKEAWEESGLHVKITGIVGEFEGDTSISRIYTAERIGGSPKDYGEETDGVVLAKPEDLHSLLNRSRDRAIASKAGIKEPPKPEKKPYSGGSFKSHIGGEKEAKPAEKLSPAAGEGSQKPLKMSDLTQTGGKLGSNPGGRYKDKDGNEYYIKKSKSPEHAKNEYLAGSLFKLAGAGTLDYVPTDNSNSIATRWQKLDKTNAKDFTPEERKKAQDDFAVHAWTSNWDAAGLDYDNQSTKSGKVVSNDLGGALSFRAQGAPKGQAFGNTVGEWETLRDKKINPQNANLFGGMTQEQLKQSAKRVTDIPDAAIRKAVKDNGLGDDMANKLIARKKDIAKKIGLQAADVQMKKKKKKRNGSFKEVQHNGRLPESEADTFGSFIDSKERREPMRKSFAGDAALHYRRKTEQLIAMDRAILNSIRADGSLRLARLALDESMRSYDHDGRLHVSSANLSKAVVNPYIGSEIPDYERLGLDPKKIYYLYRDPEELKKAAATFNGLPLLSQHQPVTADSHDHKLVVGSTGTNAIFQYPYIKNSLVVWPEGDIEKIEKDDKRQLSAGYRYTADMTRGVAPNGEKYDGVMRDIVGNHVALVEEGRAGPDVVVGDSKLRKNS